MGIEIIAGNFAQFLAFAGGNSLFWQTIRGPTTSLDLNKHQVLPLFSNQINLAVPTTIVLFQYTISAPRQGLCRQPFAGAAQPLSGGFLWIFGLLDLRHTLFHQPFHIYLRSSLTARCNSPSPVLLSYAIVGIWATDIAVGVRAI